MECCTLIARYLLQLIKKSDGYPAFKIPGAVKVGGQFVKLHDTYTHLTIVDRDTYERDKALGEFPQADRAINDSARINSLFAPKNYSKAVIDDFLSKLFQEEKLKPEEVSFVNNHDCDKESNKYCLYLSAPGGGKSTLLKMFALAYSYTCLCSIDFDFLSKEFAEIMIDGYDDSKPIAEYEREIEQCRNHIEEICELLDVHKVVLPVFVEARDLKHYTSFSNFDEIIKESITSVYSDYEDENSNCDYVFSEISANGNPIILIIDSLEELFRPGSKDSFLSELSRFVDYNNDQVEKIVLSSRYKEYQDYENEQLELNWIPVENQFVIKELFRDFDKIREFSKKWYRSLMQINGINMDVDIDFIEPLRSNFQALNLITNPLELIGMLIISVSDRFLPSDMAKLYGRSIELWITWANNQKYNFDDVMMQLSHMAYQMAVSESDRITISEEGLNKLIVDARTELQRYLKEEWESDSESIAKFRKFLRESHLFVLSGDTYEFVHRQYQAYFVAYCIKNELFSREKRKRSRYDYLESHIRQKEDFWNSIIIFISTLDVKLRDEIIEELLNYALEDVANSGYCLSILVQLAVIPGINFDSYELERLYKIIVKDEQTWTYVNRKRQDIVKVLSISDQGENDIFIKVVLDKYDSIEDVDKQDKFRDALATCVFYCTWECKVSEESIRRALKGFFANFINTNIVTEIYNTRTTGEIKKRKMCPILFDLGQEAITREVDAISDYYMLIAAIEGFSIDDITPYDVALSLIDSENLAEKLIAINILVIASWLIKIGDDKKCGFSIDYLQGKEESFAEFIVNGIADSSNDEYRRDYIAAYIDFCSTDKTSHLNELLIDIEAYKTCAIKSIEIWRRKNKDGSNKIAEYGYELEYIATCPWEYSEYFVEALSMEPEEKSTFIDYLRSVLQESKREDIKTQLEGLKLLAIVDSQGSPYDTEHYSKMKEIVSGLTKGVPRTSVMPLAKQIFNGDIRNNDKTAEAIISELGIDKIDKIDSDLSRYDMTPELSYQYVDYYSKHEYEKAKQQYLSRFNEVGSKNNLAYMLRRGEIKEVVFNGQLFDVPLLLEQGVEENEPYSLINYALYIAKDKDVFIYQKGLMFLQSRSSKVNLLAAANWWFRLRKNGELEGYLVTMWLCDLQLNYADSIDDLKKQIEEKYNGKIIFS